MHFPLDKCFQTLYTIVVQMIDIKKNRCCSKHLLPSEARFANQLYSYCLL